MGIIAIISGFIAGGSYWLDGPMWLTLSAAVAFLISFIYLLVRISKADPSNSTTETIGDILFSFPDIDTAGWGGGDGGGWSDGGSGGDCSGDGGGGGDCGGGGD